MTAIADAAAASQLALVTTYQEGFTDGVDEVLAQLEGKTRIAGTEPYTGPVPDELADWIGGVRERLEEVRADA